MKTKLIGLLMFVCISLTGCVVEADRIYTVCKDTPTERWVYNANGEFYKFDKTSSEFSKVEPVTLDAKPMLLLDLKPGDYCIVEEVPNKYKCTLEDFNNYINTLVEKDSVDYEVVCSDYKSMELSIKCSNYSMKCFYTNNDYLRLYCIDSDSNPTDPPYINEEQK